jgi:hypothetical protein
VAEQNAAVQPLLTEYERLKEEQRVRIGVRDNLIYATLASLAGVVVATVTGHGSPGPAAARRGHHTPALLAVAALEVLAILVLATQITRYADLRH